jgi:hypothetical protein
MRHQHVLPDTVILEGNQGVVGAITVLLYDQSSYRIEEIRDVSEDRFVDQEVGQSG